MKRDIKKLNRILTELGELIYKSKVIKGTVETESIISEKSDTEGWKIQEVIGREIIIKIRTYKE